ncbi:MAG: hypothetical protein AMXMBFR67_01730 [Nitrospira sp.]
MLEMGFALEEPKWELKQQKGLLLEQQQERLPQEIGLDESPIKIDTKRLSASDVLTHTRSGDSIGKRRTEQALTEN